MRYSLAELTKRTGARRKSIVFRPIEVTGALEEELDAVARAVVSGWARGIQEQILPAYEAGLPNLTRDDASDTMKAALAQVVLAGTRVIVALSPRLRTWLDRMGRWHSGQWSAAAKAATGVDVFPFIDLNANRAQIEAMQARIAGLIRGLDDDLRRRVEETVWRGFLEQTPRREMGRQLREQLAIGRRRADFIASDQANKTAAELTKIRQQEAGIEEFIWSSARDARVRPDHAALEGKRFRWDKPPSIGLPGTPPRCRCTGRAYVDLEDEDA